MKYIINVLLLLSIPSFSQTALDYFNLGEQKMQSEDFQGAIVDFNRSIALDSLNVDAYFSRGYCKDVLEDYKGAILDYTKVITLLPDDFTTYFNRATAYYNLKNYALAIEDYSKVIELNPNEPDAYYKRGLVKFELYDIGACTDWKKALELGDLEVKELISAYCK